MQFQSRLANDAAGFAHEQTVQSGRRGTAGAVAVQASGAPLDTHARAADATRCPSSPNKRASIDKINAQPRFSGSINIACIDFQSRSRRKRLARVASGGCDTSDADKSVHFDIFNSPWNLFGLRWTITTTKYDID
ncbi:unnamed protein product [Leptosia nina]|uniref:Uncharacterized protein n=1 Tax=Leptosia nina TaxID=320188 RepID=A0AAV1JXR3_9NEOP